MQHLKRILRTSVINIFGMKLDIFVIKILKKIDFSEIRLKIPVGFCQTRPNFRAAIQDMLKMTALPLSQHKSRKSQGI